MANLNIRKPRFYVDLINFLQNRDTAGGHYGISTSTNQIDVVSGNNIANLYDMRPLNQVEFNTTGDTDGHVNLWFDLKTSGFKVDFVAILNHNMHSTDAKVRISSSETKSHVEAVDHASATNTESGNVLTEIIGAGDISNNKGMPDNTNSWDTGHMIVEFPEQADRYWGIQFEGTNSQSSTGHGDGTFDGSTNLKIGCILLGQYYDMPHSPDLSVKRSIDFDGVKVQESLGGQRFSTMTQHGRQNITSTNKSPFHTYYNSFGAYGGRMSYDMKFSYLNSTDIMPNNYNEFQPNDEAIMEDLWNKTNGRHTPFIFTQDGTSTSYSDYLFARFGQDKLDMTQVAPDVFNVAMRIEEEF
jgi:hypothetical protein